MRRCCNTCGFENCTIKADDAYFKDMLLCENYVAKKEKHKVKMYAYLALLHVAIGEPLETLQWFLKNDLGYKRVPSEDKEVEVEE